MGEYYSTIKKQLKCCLTIYMGEGFKVESTGRYLLMLRKGWEDRRKGTLLTHRLPGQSKDWDLHWKIRRCPLLPIFYHQANKASVTITAVYSWRNFLQGQHKRKHQSQSGRQKQWDKVMEGISASGAHSYNKFNCSPTSGGINIKLHTEHLFSSVFTALFDMLCFQQQQQKYKVCQKVGKKKTGWRDKTILTRHDMTQMLE